MSARIVLPDFCIMAGFGGKASAGTLSKAEYLKRYLGGGPPGAEEAKKRRKKKSHGQAPSRLGGGRGMRIVDDDDVGWKDPASKQAGGADEEEDLPVVAEFVDERPKEIKLMEEFRSGNKWKVLRDDREDSQGSDLSMAAKSTASSDARSRDKETEEAGYSPKHSPTRRTRQDSPESLPSLAVRDTSPPSMPRQRHDSSESSSPLRERLDSPELLQHRKQRHDSPDQSPPRKGRHDSPDQSPLRKACHDSADQLPLREGRHDTPDQSPLRTGRHDSPDLSPTRKRYPASPDLSLPRKGRRTSPDLSPSRKGRRVATDNKFLVSKNGKSTKMLTKDRSSPSHRKDSSSSDLSPPRYKRHDSDSDMSPPRKKRTTNEKKPRDSQALAASPKRRTRPNNSTSPPPRRPTVRPASDSDLSPPRNRGKSGAATRGSDSDLSPPRKTLRKSSDSDLSPPRRAPATKRSPSRQRGDACQSSQMLSGGIAGLVSADVLRKEKKVSKQKERENKPLEEESKTAATVFRDKAGRKRDLQAEREEQRRTAGVKSQRDEQYAQWGQGLAQRQMQQQNVLDAAREIEKPLARYIDDQDLDQMLREQERDGDPMANFIKKKKVIEDKKARPRYNGPDPPPNRFNIWPGHRWDGVDRSNGFEQKRFARQSDQKAVQELAYKWSVEDM